MYIGRYQPPQNLITTVENTSNLEIGHLVAIHCEDCPTEPAIGEVTDIGIDDINLKWMEGTYSTAWHYYKILDARDRRKKVDWIQSVPRSSILLFNFTFTKTNHLKKKTVLKLKELYTREHTTSSS